MSAVSGRGGRGKKVAVRKARVIEVRRGSKGERMRSGKGGKGEVWKGE